MDQLAYTEAEAVKKVGIVLSVGTILTVISFACSSPIAKRLNCYIEQKMQPNMTVVIILLHRITERKALILGGLIPLLLCHIIIMPFSGPTPKMQETSFHSMTLYTFLKWLYLMDSVFDFWSDQSDYELPNSISNFSSISNSTAHQGISFNTRENMWPILEPFI